MIFTSVKITDQYIDKFFNNNFPLIDNLKPCMLSVDYINECVKQKELINKEKFLISLSNGCGSGRSSKSKFDLENKEFIHNKAVEIMESIENSYSFTIFKKKSAASSQVENVKVENENASPILNNVNEKLYKNEKNEKLEKLENLEKIEKEVQNVDIIEDINKKPNINYSYYENDNIKTEFLPNLNEHITSKLDKLLAYHTVENNKIKMTAYRNAIAEIRNHKERISNPGQIANLKYLGKHISRKIKEILLTGNLKKTDYICNDPRNKAIKILEGVYGIGAKFASQLYKRGIKTIDDLKQNKNLLSENQLIGLKYHDDLCVRIPREECIAILSAVKKELFEILPEEILQVEMCGSFRRGKETCGDIDILITRKDEGSIEGILETLIKKLYKNSFLQETLSISNTGKQRFQFMGICKLLKVSRRIDIKIYLKQYYAFALLYFTGSAHFNRELRFHANKSGYNLTDLCLEKVNEYTRKKYTTGEYVICETELEIFQALKLTYKSPEERDI
jgi:DNA polymerase/3'-5' exonuclease PolX